MRHLPDALTLNAGPTDSLLHDLLYGPEFLQGRDPGDEAPDRLELALHQYAHSWCDDPGCEPCRDLR